MRFAFCLAVSLGLLACSSTPTIKLAKTTFKTGEEINVLYSSAVKSKDDSKYWVTITQKGQPDSTWGDWHYVAAGASSDSLKAGTQPGDYEIRLHDDYPKQQYHVVSRAELKVE